MEVALSSETSVDFHRLHSVISQETELFFAAQAICIVSHTVAFTVRVKEAVEAHRVVRRRGSYIF
jgi:hypothetical protein